MGEGLDRLAESHVIGEDTSERLDKVPATLKVIVTRRPKYACRACEKTGAGETAGVIQAPAPLRLIEGGLPTEALVDGLLVVVAGFLLLLPGFVSDVLAILLVIPPIRKLVRARILAAAERRIASGAGRSRVSFGFGSAGTGFGGFGGFGDAGRVPGGPIADADIIDLDAEEVVIDEPRGELGGPGPTPR